VRRVVPWVLVLLIGVGAGLGAALGSAGSSVVAGPEAQQWLAGVLATTKAAGTAHLDSTSVTTSPNSDLRDSGAGSGVVDFATGSYRVNETDRIVERSPRNSGPTDAPSLTTTLEEIVIGRSNYVGFGVPGFFPDIWTKQSTQGDSGELGLGSSEVFGAFLSALSGPFTALTVTQLGTATIGGASTTRYLAQTQVEPSTSSPCPARKGNPLLGRATVWVDGEGRLVQVRMQSSIGGKVPASAVKRNPSIADEPLGPITFTGTLRFSGFGAVHIARPALDPVRTALSVPIIGDSSVATCGSTPRPLTPRRT
jgi:hypothetical protein